MATVNNADIAAGVEAHIAQLAASVPVSKSVVRVVVDVVAEHLDANGPLPSDPQASIESFAGLLPKIVADKRLQGLTLGAPPAPASPGGGAIAPVPVPVAGLIVLAELAVVGYVIYREFQE